MGRSCTSIDRPKDEFWDGMTNPALSTSKDDVNTLPDTTGPQSIPLSSVVPEVNIQTRDHQIKGK